MFLRKMFDAAIECALPKHNLSRHLPPPPKGKTIVIGAGKASAAMAQALEEHWQGPLQGLVVTRYGHAVKCHKIEIVEAAHPVPDEKGSDAARRILAMVQGLTKDDLVIALISGGGSALLSLPAPGIGAEDKRTLNKMLLACGAPIAEMNCVRKHLSAIKGGRLAAAAFPARMVSLVISDVPGDDLAAVASGPTVPDPTTFEEARAIIAKYGLTPPSSIRRHLAEASDETPKPGDRKFANTESILIASPQLSLTAAAEVARQAGVTPLILGDSLEGEAREIGVLMAGIARHVRKFGQPLAPPCVLLSGGETTVTVRGKGFGGRNVEFLAALAHRLAGAENIYAIAADTDGIDGAREVAGAIIDPTTQSRARSLRIDIHHILANNDAHTMFEQLGDQVVTGPTLTNVNDFRAILVL